MLGCYCITYALSVLFFNFSMFSGVIHVCPLWNLKYIDIMVNLSFAGNYVQACHIYESCNFVEGIFIYNPYVAKIKFLLFFPD